MITAKLSKVTTAPLSKSRSSVEWMVLNVLLESFERFLSLTAERALPVEFLKRPRTNTSLTHGRDR